MTDVAYRTGFGACFGIPSRKKRESCGEMCYLFLPMLFS